MHRFAPTSPRAVKPDGSTSRVTYVLFEMCDLRIALAPFDRTSPAAPRSTSLVRETREPGTSDPLERHRHEAPVLQTPLHHPKRLMYPCRHNAESLRSAYKRGT